jgi:hypothetical protein
MEELSGREKIHEVAALACFIPGTRLGRSMTYREFGGT